MLRQVFLSGTFIRLALALSSIGLVGSAFGLHLAPALMDKGMDGTMAATIAGLFGLMAIIGRLALGAIFDRVGQVTVTTGVMALYRAGRSHPCPAQQQCRAGDYRLCRAGAWRGRHGRRCRLPGGAAVPRLDFWRGLWHADQHLGARRRDRAACSSAWIHDVTGSYAPAFWSGVGIAAVVAVC